MNGRIYDPLLGRFMSADILVQNPASLQSFNRYSYIANNPLSGTDPSGFADTFQEWVKKHANDENVKKMLAAMAKAGVSSFAVDVAKGVVALVVSTKADQAQPTGSTPNVEKTADGQVAAESDQGRVNSQRSETGSNLTPGAASTEKSRDQGKPARKIEAIDDPDRGTDADAAKRTNELLNILRGSVNDRVKVHRSTRVAQMLKELDQGGYIEFGARRGRTGATTWGLSYDEVDLNGRSKRVDLSYGVYGKCMPSLIEFDPYAKDALSVLAHEIAHAYLLNKGEQQSAAAGPVFSETESKRVENEIRVLLEHQDPDPDYNGVLIPKPEFYLEN